MLYEIDMRYRSSGLLVLFGVGCVVTPSATSPSTRASASMSATASAPASAPAMAPPTATSEPLPPVPANLGPCEAPTPATKVTELSDWDIARLAIPTFDPSTAKAPTTKQGAGLVVRSCRGSTAPAGLGADPNDAGKVIVQRVDLPDGRQVAWITTRSEERVPEGVRYVPNATSNPEKSWDGFLAVVRVEGGRAMIEAIGPFVHQTGNERATRAERLGPEPVYVTPRSNALGLTWARLWIARGGELQLLEEFQLHGDSLTNDTRQTMDSTLSFEHERVRMHRRTIWTKQDVVRTYDEDDYFALDGDHLVKRWPK